MIISTKKGAPQAELDRIIDNFEHQGLSVTLIRGTDYNVFGLVGDTTKIAEKDVLANPWVENVTRVSAPYKRANRLFHPDDTVVDVNGIKIGGKSPIAVMAGPCSRGGRGADHHHRQGWSRPAARPSCAAALTSPAPAPIPSRASAPRAASNLREGQVRRPACPSSPS